MVCGSDTIQTPTDTFRHHPDNHRHHQTPSRHPQTLSGTIQTPNDTIKHNPDTQRHLQKPTRHLQVPSDTIQTLTDIIRTIQTPIDTVRLHQEILAIFGYILAIFHFWAKRKIFTTELGLKSLYAKFEPNWRKFVLVKNFGHFWLYLSHFSFLGQTKKILF